MDGMTSLANEASPVVNQIETKADSAGELHELAQIEKKKDAVLVAKAEKRRRRLTEFLPSNSNEALHSISLSDAEHKIEDVSPISAGEQEVARETQCEAPSVISGDVLDADHSGALPSRGKKPRRKKVRAAEAVTAVQEVMPSDSSHPESPNQDFESTEGLIDESAWPSGAREESSDSQPGDQRDASAIVPGSAESSVPSAGDASQPHHEHVGTTPESSEEKPALEIYPHRVVEAILMASDSPLTPAKIANVLGIGTARDIRKHVEQLNAQYESQQLSIRIREIGGGYQIHTLPEYDRWLSKLSRARQETKLTGASLETLSIIAYKQPCTRADIEAIRGVAAGDLINRLREMNLVKIVGRAEDLGRPLLYGTTQRFLETFGLPSLEDLPQVEAFKSGKKAEPKPAMNPAENKPEIQAQASESAEFDASAAAETPSSTCESHPESSEPS